jgi:hypothetical protein
MKKPALFRNLTDLEIKEFNTIYNKINHSYKEYEKQRLKRENRKHQIGTGHPFKLPLQNRLLMFLIYYRLYITSTLTGFLFDLDQSNVLKDIRKLELHLKKVLPTQRNFTTKLDAYKQLKRLKKCCQSLVLLLTLQNRRFQGLKINVNVKLVTVGKRNATR